MTLLEERSTAATDPRRAMIDSQLRVSGVNDPAVLAAMAAVAREDYAPDALKAAAYIDRALPLGDGHALPAPLVHGKMLTEAALQPGEAVLVVSASGYLAAVARGMGAEVTEIAPAALAGTRKKALFDLVLIDGAAQVLPDSLATLITPGGRIIAGQVDGAVTRLAVGRKAGGSLSFLPLADIGIPALPEFAAPKGWSF